ncbi:MAG: Pathogenesis-related transcriptional factor and ERF protein [Bacteroidota bacterium]
MAFRIQLKNSEKYAYLDEQVYHTLNNDKELAQYGFLTNLREHSSGCAVFQKTRRKEDGDGFEVLTIYLHKLIAERFLSDNKTAANNLVGCKNGNKLDCRLDNLEYRSRSTASRKRKSSSKLGYTGVYQENNRYRAVISINRKSVHIGMFATPEEAAEAYNRKSRELYGDLGKINVIRPHAARGDGGGFSGIDAGAGASESTIHRDSLRRMEKEE